MQIGPRTGHLGLDHGRMLEQHAGLAGEPDPPSLPFHQRDVEVARQPGQLLRHCGRRQVQCHRRRGDGAPPLHLLQHA